MNNQIFVTTSWDDGHKLDIKLAKLLKKYGVKGTFYVSPQENEFNQTDLLNNHDVKMLSKNFEIGAHSMSHPHLSKIPLKLANYEISESKKYLEKIIGKKVVSFCYPYGDYNDNVVKLVKKNGFLLGRTTKRYCFEKPANPFEMDTTFNTFFHRDDIYKVISNTGLNPLHLFHYLDWEYLAKNMFDHVLKEKKVFHLWGHSWEIEKFHHWNKLERVLQHISNKKNVSYITNGEFI